MSKIYSTWGEEITLPPAHDALTGGISADVVIIGGGLAGSLTAYLLAKAGKKTVVLDKKDMASCTTAYTTAWLNCVIDTDLADLIKMYGPEGARAVWNSGMDAIALIEKIIKDENIDCDFKRVPHYRHSASRSEMENLKREHQAAQSLGFETTLHVSARLPWKNSGSIELPDQAKFHPVKFLIALRRASEKYGAVFYENTEALEVQNGKEVLVTTQSGSVSAGWAVIATYKPFNKPKELFAHTGMYVSYVFEVEIPKCAIPEGLYEDEKNPYHYFRIDAGEKSDRMILGGEDHRKEIPIAKQKNFNALKSYLHTLLPDAKYKITRKWAGPILETIDGLPYIGSYSKKHKKHKNILVATGFSGNGMTYSAVSARINADIILRKENPYKRIYAASRKTSFYSFFIKGRDFALELFGGFLKNIL